MVYCLSVASAVPACQIRCSSRPAASAPSLCILTLSQYCAASERVGIAFVQYIVDDCDGDDVSGIVDGALLLLRDLISQ